MTALLLVPVVTGLVVSLSVLMIGEVWRDYWMQLRSRFRHIARRANERVRTDPRPDGLDDEKPTALVLMTADKTLDEELLWLAAHLRAPYEPSRPSDESEQPSIAEF